ncbi:hypothetical protein B9Z55_001648 [Caenorhabditis nigoni]|uniref:Uncharacterized protein n=1 Tax=Caenorhabditis nigoni TaxID=1611254 RepID=A0A2G5VGN8_9PELO|nr:hypothetical protein B9Z55_001648 [Caenorhabditis nigoni]
MILSRENQDLRHNLSIAEKQLKILTRDVERLTAENRKRKTELYQSKAKETLMLAKKKGKWKKQQKPRRKSFDSLTNYLAQITQTDEAIVQYLSVLIPRNFSLYKKNVVGAKGEKLVTVVQLNNVAEYVTTRVQQLYDSEKLEFPEGCKGKLWLAVMGDKGSEEVKLCLEIGNVARRNIYHHLIPLGYYTDDETSTTLLEHLGKNC